MARILRCVQLAGLLHDVGHGPLSHTFDEVVAPTWEHEERSQALAQYICQMAKGWEGGDVDLVVQLIHPTRQPLKEIPPYVYQIVCNLQSVMDVDKMDYLMRDYHELQAKPLHIDVYGIISRTSATSEGVLCFHGQDYRAVRELLELRTALHHEHYRNPLILVGDLMIQSIIKDVFKPASCASAIEYALSVAQYDDLSIWESGHPLVSQVEQRQWTYTHVGDTRRPPPDAEGQVVQVWDIEYSVHHPNNAMQLMSFHPPPSPYPGPHPWTPQHIYRTFIRRPPHGGAGQEDPSSPL